MASLEIERKFLLPTVPALDHPTLAQAERRRIEQTYLRDEDGWRRRLRRMRLDSGEERLYYTRKRPLGPVSPSSPLMREEDERRVDGAEYEQLLLERDPGFLPLLKTRLVFAHGSHTIELDLFDRYPTLALVEVELAAEDEEVSLPPFLGPAVDVSGVSGYSSRSLARREPPEVARGHESSQSS